MKIGLKTRCRAYSRILGIQRKWFTSSDLGSLREVSDLSASWLLKALREASVTDHQEKDQMHFCNGLQSKKGKFEGFVSGHIPASNGGSDEDGVGDDGVGNCGLRVSEMALFSLSEEEKLAALVVALVPPPLATPGPVKETETGACDTGCSCC